TKPFISSIRLGYQAACNCWPGRWRLVMENLAPSDWVVLIGFAGLLALMGALAIDSARQMHDVSETGTALRKGSRDRDALLDQLRTDTYRSATLVRDYVLDHDDVRALHQKAELLAVRSRVEDALNQYAIKAPLEEKSAIESLKQHAESYWS